MTTTVIVGGNFAGMTAAIEIKRRDKKGHRVILVDKSPSFLYIPSLVWIPFKKRDVSDISFERKEILTKKGIEFIHAEALNVDTNSQIVSTSKGNFEYDHLVIATGPKVNSDIAPGVREYSYCAGSLNGAVRLREVLENFKKTPGPVVVGVTQNASFIAPSYEILFNMEKWLRDQKIRKKVDLTWITPEDYIGHLGVEGFPLSKKIIKLLLKMFNINYRESVAVREVTSNSVILTSGEEIKSSLSILMPPFTGADFVQDSPSLKATANGYIPVDDSYRHKEINNVWAAGIAVQVDPPFKCKKIPFSAPKTGYPSDVTGKIVAENIVRTAKGKKKLIKKPWGKIPEIHVVDAGKKEILIFANHSFRPRNFAIMIPNILSDSFKVLVEKYFLWKFKKGYSKLP